MKKFLFPTDFSANAKHALDYGYSLAKQVKADMIICNAIIEPAEIPQSGIVSWPMEESDLLLIDSSHELNLLKAHLEDKEETISFNPHINCISEAGTVTEIINQVAHNHEIDLVVIGTHGSSGLTTLLLGNHSREVIDAINKPLLLVPPSAEIVPVKKIAFATDFKHPAKDLECIYKLITLARPLNADILLTHIFNEKELSASFQHWINEFMIELADRANYPHIYYRLVKSGGTVTGLDWVAEHGQVDILAMVHHNHSFLDSLYNGSQTQKMADHIAIPLLVFPANS